MSLSVSASGMRAASTRQSVTAHNVANVNTPGFRALRAQNTTRAEGGVEVSVSPPTATGNVASADALASLPDPMARSNVDMAREQVGSIVNTNSFKANANAFRAQDDALGTLMNIVG